MAYTKQTWSGGDTVTAAKLNHMEDGIANAGSVASVRVDWQGWSGTVGYCIVYARPVAGEDFYSAESVVDGHYALTLYESRSYVPVPIPPSGDEFKAFIVFDSNYYVSANITTTGGVSSTVTYLAQRLEESMWSSATWYGFEVTGDGTLTNTYQD